jgi:uncharacterized protein YkwD
MFLRTKYLLYLLSLLALVSACGRGTTPTAQPTDLPTLTNPAPSATPTLTALPSPSPTASPEPTETEIPTATLPPAIPSSPTPAIVETQPSPSPTQAAQVENPTPAISDCINKAAFYADLTIPDDTVVEQQEKFTKTWRVSNEGTCIWENYQLVYAGGEAMNANPANPVPLARPDEVVDISVDMQAPTRGGSYTSYWQFAAPNGVNFGVGAGADGLLWVRVTVDFGSDQSTTAPASSSGCSLKPDPGVADQILELVNSTRGSAGLGTVSMESRLNAAAAQHSLDMACNDFVSHTGSNGSLWYQRVADQGYANSSSARENIYVGNPAFGGDAQGAFTWWMNSQIHRDNILNPNVSQVGIAYVFNPDSTYGGYYTLILARP